MKFMEFSNETSDEQQLKWKEWKKIESKADNFLLNIKYYTGKHNTFTAHEALILSIWHISKKWESECYRSMHLIYYFHRNIVLNLQNI